MATERVTASLNTYRALPKVELHRHLEGSLRLDTMLDVARQHGITIPADVLRLSTLVQVQEEDKFTFQNFLAKFNTLRLFYRSPDVIDRITREAIEDAAKDNVKYMELRFTPVALSRAERFPLHDVIDWVMTSNCKLGHVKKVEAPSPDMVGKVLKQRPRAGKVLAPGSRVRVTLGS